MVLANDPLKRLRLIGGPTDGHLDEELLASIARLPARQRHKLTRWLDHVVRELERSNEEESISDAAQRAVDLGAARERARLARELHDEVGADLAAAVALFKYYFETPTAVGDGDAVLHNIYEIVSATLLQTRTMMRSLRSHQMGPGGLVGDLRTLAEDYLRRHDIAVDVDVSGAEDELSQAQREVVYHVVREALSNIRRHSGASRCTVTLNFAAQPFLVEVSDSGAGISEPSGEGYGLIGMRERAAGIGGRLQVVSGPGQGTTVFLFGPESASSALGA
jgi:signal transduction histidine kinase